MPSKGKSRKQSMKAMAKRRRHSRRMRGGDSECDRLLEKRIDAELEHLACMFEMIAKDPYLSTLFGLHILQADIGIQAAQDAMVALEMNSMMPGVTIEQLPNNYNMQRRSNGPLLLTNAGYNANGKPILVGGETAEERAARLQREANARAKAEANAITGRQRLNLTDRALLRMQQYGTEESRLGFALGAVGVSGGLGLAALGIIGAATGGTVFALSLVAGGVGTAAMGYRGFRGVQARSSGRDTIVAIMIAMIQDGTTSPAALRAIEALESTEIERIQRAVEEAKNNNATIEKCTELVTEMVTNVAKTTLEEGGKLGVAGFGAAEKIGVAGLGAAEKIGVAGLGAAERGAVAVANNLGNVGTAIANKGGDALIAAAPAVIELAKGGKEVLEKGGDALVLLAEGAQQVSKDLGQASKTLLEAIPSGAAEVATMVKSGASALHQNAKDLAQVAHQDARNLAGQVRSDVQSAAERVGNAAASVLSAASRRRGTPASGNGSGDPTSMKKPIL